MVFLLLFFVFLEIITLQMRHIYILDYNKTFYLHNPIIFVYSSVYVTFFFFVSGKSSFLKLRMIYGSDGELKRFLRILDKTQCC